MRLVRGFGQFWWDFIVGEDWKIAAGVAFVLSIGALLVAYSGASDTTISLLVAAGIVCVVAASIIGGVVGSNRQ
jgi:hypothetical protein